MPGGCDADVTKDLARRLGRAVPLANMAGAATVFCYLMLTLGPEAGESTQTLPWRDLAVFAAVAGLLWVVGGYRCKRRVDTAVCWIDEDRAPTRHERDATLRIPGTIALECAVMWLLAAAFYAVATWVDTDHTGDHVLRITLGIVLGGVVTCAVVYLLLERVCRDAFARALAGEAAERPRTMGVRPRLLLAWAAGSAVPLVALGLSPAAWEPGSRVSQGTAVVVLAVLGLATGIGATLLASRSVAEPLDRIREALGRVEQGDLDAQLAVDDAGEVGMVQAGFNRMVSGLRERERLRDLFGRHVGDEVARNALVIGTGLGGEQREASVLFVDIIGSTAMAEVLAPEEVVATLNALFAATARSAAAEGGWVNKFEGDGAMCVFGAPSAHVDHAARALRAARALDVALRREGAAHPGLDVGIGVSSGLVVAGNVGAEHRYEYTIIGRPVNEAARLTEIAKGRPGRVLASEAALDRAGEEAAHWAAVGTVALRGWSTPTELFEPMTTVRVPPGI